MIAYSRMTLRQAIDHVKNYVLPHVRPENFDRATVVRYLNRAVTEVQMTTMPYKDWAYVSTLSVQHMVRLPHRYIAPMRVMCGEVSGALTEARIVKPKEWYALVNWETRQGWSRASVLRPVCTFWGQKDGVSMAASQTIIMIYPNNTVPNPDDRRPIERAYLDCYLSPPDMVADVDLLPMPYEYENLVVMSAAVRFLSLTGNVEPLELLQKAVVMERMKMLERYNERIKTEKQQLASFVAPVQPLVPPMGTEGELKQVMT